MADASPALTWSDVGHSGTLTNYSGSYDISSSNQTLEDYRFTSTLTQETTADNLTIRNCHFDLQGANYAFNNEYNQSPTTSVTFEDCTFEGTASSQMLLGGSGTKTLRRCRYRDGRGDFVKLYSTATVNFEDCYFGGLSRTVFGQEDFHADGFQVEGPVTVNLTRCTWDMVPAQGGLQIPVTSGSWLESDGVSAGGTAGQIYYKGSISFFVNDGAGAPQIYFTSCHFVGNGSNGIHLDETFPTAYLEDCRFYPSRTWDWRVGDGTYVDNGGNVWIEAGTDLRGNSHDQFDSVFTGLTIDPPSDYGSASNNRPLTTGGRILLRGGLPLIAG